MKKAGLDYDFLDFRKDFPQLRDYEPLPLLQEMKEAIEALPPEARAKCVSMADLRKLPEAGDICRKVDQFMELFGHLSESGTDLSYTKWEEDPEALFRMILATDGETRSRELCSLDDLRERGVRVSPVTEKGLSQGGKVQGLP
ncbi:MAG: hypothetical protein MZV63_61070 [Marinilabiliales bacterium]|nr:hypothetical protein [Marinilabiliales bacterium]